MALFGFRSESSKPCWHLDASAVKGVQSAVRVDWRKPTCCTVWCYQILEPKIFHERKIPLKCYLQTVFLVVMNCWIRRRVMDCLDILYHLCIVRPVQQEQHGKSTAIEQQLITSVIIDPMAMRRPQQPVSQRSQPDPEWCSDGDREEGEQGQAILFYDLYLADPSWRLCQIVQMKSESDSPTQKTSKKWYHTWSD